MRCHAALMIKVWNFGDFFFCVFWADSNSVHSHQRFVTHGGFIEQMYNPYSSRIDNPDSWIIHVICIRRIDVLRTLNTRTDSPWARIIRRNRSMKQPNTSQPTDNTVWFQVPEVGVPRVYEINVILSRLHLFNQLVNLPKLLYRGQNFISLADTYSQKPFQSNYLFSKPFKRTKTFETFLEFSLTSQC